MKYSKLLLQARKFRRLELNSFCRKCGERAGKQAGVEGSSNWSDRSLMNAAKTLESGTNKKEYPALMK